MSDVLPPGPAPPSTALRPPPRRHASICSNSNGSYGRNLSLPGSLSQPPQRHSGGETSNCSLPHTTSTHKETTPANGRPASMSAPPAPPAATADALPAAGEVEQIAECTPADDPEADKLLQLHASLGVPHACFATTFQLLCNGVKSLPCSCVHAWRERGR